MSSLMKIYQQIKLRFIKMEINTNKMKKLNKIKNTQRE